MHTLQNQMLIDGDPRGPFLRRRTPRHEHNTITPHLDHGVDYLLRQQLPAFALVRVRLAPAHRQTRVEQQHAAVGPGGQQAAFLRRRHVVRIVFLQRFVDVGQRGGRGGGRAHGEGEPVGLVGAVVGVLPSYDYFDGIERRVAGPFGGGVSRLSGGLDVEGESGGGGGVTYHEYTSFIGGYTVFPLLSSFFKNRFSSRNCGFTSTSLR